MKPFKSTALFLVAMLLVVALAALWRVQPVAGQGPFGPKPQPEIFGGKVPQAGASGVNLPQRDIYALDADNTLHVLRACRPSFRRQFRVQNVIGNLTGIDFRPADGLLYAVSDAGYVYTIDVEKDDRGEASTVAAINPRFAGGFQALMDFNPVVNALRLIGTNDQNFALVSSGGNLNVTAVQTALQYAAGDVAAGVDPNICGGSYTNNVAGATATVFFALDHDLDTLVTIAGPLVGAGSSNTGGGQLQTLGPLATFDGNPFRISATADLDIYTENGVNYLLGISGRKLFSIDLAQAPQLPPLGTVRRITVRTVDLGPANFIDLAVAPARRECGGKD